MRVAQWENRLMEERSTQIFETLQKQQEDLKQEAEAVDEKQEQVWREQGNFSPCVTPDLLNINDYDIFRAEGQRG
jgi:hypothetical protein